MKKEQTTSPMGDKEPTKTEKPKLLELTPSQLIEAYKKCAYSELAKDCDGCRYQGQENCHRLLADDVIYLLEKQQKTVDVLQREIKVYNNTLIMMSRELECNHCRFRNTCLELKERKGNITATGCAAYWQAMTEIAMEECGKIKKRYAERSEAEHLQIIFEATLGGEEK